MSKDTSYGCWKDVSLFKMGQIFGLHQAQKTSKELQKPGRKVSNNSLVDRKKKSQINIFGKHLNIWWNQMFQLFEITSKGKQ